ncbi:uncharacterized protein [Temnothorax nylanderi]|uniref:uncharacterized protein n=1 Tax=Temnothorax nylanderi TaxID=102681 RepID=UPI003A842EE8
MWPHLRDLPLADPDPSCNHPIHVLIGADLYGSLLLDGLRQGPVGTPTGQLTIFGWILSGPAGPARPAGESASVLSCVSCEDTNSLIQSFWEDERIPSRTPLTEEDERCEKHFATTHSRDSQGRYIVRLPFKNGPPRVGDTFRKASFLYSNMERRLARKPEIAAQYHDFLREYESMGHMESVRADERPPYPPIYIPHHFVLRESSTTTKLRVVFNASSESTDKTSLNDFLMAGPKLQQDIAAIILRWRLFRYVYMADIAKMFRQILVHRDDADYQRILWRPPDSLLIRLYRLLTVTYGQKPSPFLAQRSFIQLARDEGKDFPDAVNIIEESTYVDDVLFGADDLLSLLEKRNQLVGIMNRGCFPLRKWAANSAELLTDIPEDQRESSDYPINHDDTLKVLGLSWSPRDDSFRFVISPYAVTVHTKRSVLSFIAKLYDPLGWASPIVIAAKMLMQELWLRKIDWDAPIPDDLLHQWINYVSDLPNISKIRIPRWTGMRQDKIDVELHGFADASTRAYAAVVFLRIVHSPSNIQVIHLAAKTKVAPLKTVSVPRLELNAVVLLIRLIEWVRNTTGLMRALLFGWTDSQIVLAWLLQHPSRWNSYVANRVSEVQTRLPTVRWQHVRSQENPADCASRGFTAADLVNHELWWSGPRWLSSTTASWPIPPTPTEKDILQTVSSEARKATVHLVDSAPEWDLPTSCSSWIRLLRITAYIRRFVRNLKNKVASSVIVKSPLTAEEIHEASVFWLRSAQATCFSDDLKALNAHAAVSRSSSLRSLHPFIGKDKLIRLGGRLENSALSYNERHPVILARHHIAELLIDQAHRRSLHVGTKLTLRCLRQNYWLISARSMIKSHIHKCVTCVRHSAKTPTQLMGDLPSPRVNPAPPFSHTGIDYAGPMNITPVVGRGQKGSKHYVAVFVCLATKAIHLESVEDYSTDGFLAAFQRFVSRRGLPSDMYSDNGTNFVGADRELQRSFRALVNNPSLKEILANDGVRWHFVPPAAPHFGGLWEAGVKSFKHHLRRVTGARTLSRSEFVTLLCKIEACLNSRPISPLSDDPSDYTALTPGHFLIGRPLTSVPEESVLEINANRLSRWQHVQLMLEQIWRSWSSDYLHSLQQRVKWTESHDNPKVDELVLLKSNLLPPSKWELARILQVHPGLDGRVRVVTLRTANSELKRPITQICRLPASISPPGTAESR